MQDYITMWDDASTTPTAFIRTLRAQMLRNREEVGAAPRLVTDDYVGDVPESASLICTRPNCMGGCAEATIRNAVAHMSNDAEPEEVLLF